MKKTAILLFVLLIMSCGCTNISGGVTSVPETTPAVAETEGTEEAVEAVIYIDEDAIESSEKAFQPEPEKPAEPASVNIVCAGDNLIHTPIYRIAKETAGGEGYEFSPAYEHLGTLISDADLAILNQETIISDEFEPDTYPTFCTPTEMARDMTELGFDAFSISNNHVLDKGEAGLISTLRFWKENYPDKPVYGAYLSEADMNDIRTLEVNGIKFAFAAKDEETDTAEDEEELIKGWRGVLCMISPLVPLVLVMAFKIEIIPAFLCAIIWLAIFSQGGFAKKMNVLSKTAHKGLQDVAMVIWLLVGIGILVRAVMHPDTKAVLQPMLQAIMPTSRIPFILFFALLAPLSLYRGPLNLFGMGSGICALLVTAGIYTPLQAMGGFVACERLQSVGCPTNSQNAWTCSYVGLDVNDVTKKLLPPLWIMAAAGACVAGFLYI